MSRENSVDAAITVSEVFLVEFLQNRKEVSKMILGSNITMEEYGQVQRENGRLEGLQEGHQKGKQEGLLKGITVLIQDNLKQGISKECILSKLTDNFNFTNDEAVGYYEQVTKEL